MQRLKPIGAGVSTAIAPYINDIVKDGSTALREFLRVFISKGSTVHGCTGPAASDKCNDSYGHYNPVLVGPNGVK